MRALLLSLAVIVPLPVFAACPSVGPFEEGIGGTAAQYASTGGFSLDDEGILVLDYGTRYGNLGKWHNPFFISRYANGLYADWYRAGCEDDALRSAFLRQVEWFADNVEMRDGMAVWPYEFPNPHYHLNAGWISGIGQSHIAAVLYRGFALTGDERLRELSTAAMVPYFRSIEDGGVAAYGDGGVWIQEAPEADGKAYNVLNGHITGLYGVLDMERMTGGPKYRQLIENAIDAVRSQLDKFDAGFTSFYAMRGPEGREVEIAPLDDYHNLHIRQLETLYELDGDPIFLEFAERFKGYQQVVFDRTASGFNLETHGPEQADGKASSTYWSHAQFPTWFQVSWDSGHALEGLYLKGQNPLSTPRSFSVLLRHQGDWVEVFTTTANEDQQIYFSFPEPVAADAVRIDIRSDNGGRNAALNNVSPILAREKSGSRPMKGAAFIAKFAPGFR